MRLILLAYPLLLLGACHRGPQFPADPSANSTPSATPADPLAANDTAVLQSGESDPRLIMQAQVVLDRLGFTPGVIDGKDGLSTRNALAGFQEANGLPVSGKFDASTREKLGQWSTIPATRVVTVPADFAAGPFQPLPKSPPEQAGLPALDYESLEEKLAERFHASAETLRLLNPGQWPNPGFAPVGPSGLKLRVPNVGHDRIDPSVLGGDVDWQHTLALLGVGTEQPQVDKIVVSKARSVLKGYDAAGKLVAVYTATMGSKHDPLPLGQWKVNGVSRNPKFHYNPALFWDARPGARKATLPPGPNNPVGVVWIDLSKPHYGIHGTPSPESIGRAESHGCVRLTNWDAARLSLMVKPGTQVLFEK